MAVTREVKLSESAEVTHAHGVALLLMGRGKSEGRAALGPLSARIPIWQLAQLDAMGAKAGKSRNAMVALVLQAGIAAIRSHLDETTSEELDELESEASAKLNGVETESGETF